MIKKLIVTNRSSLERKYGADGWSTIKKAIVRLATADVMRGLTTAVEFVDLPGARGVPKVTRADSPKQVKTTIDALYLKHRAPDYLLILGAPDVIPYQRLRNPLAGSDDTDPDLPGDLPYACDAPYSRDVNDFVGPTRVVGRLPDERGSRKAAALVALIDAAARFDGTPGKQTFSISASEWKGATHTNVKLAFGGRPRVELCPPRGPGWDPARLRAPLHFINCHGALKNPNYYGSAPRYPEAHLPGNLAGAVARGTVVVAECCYGAELYNPTAHVALGIANTYLQQGAVAYLGSTNIAYGEATARKRCAADILCTGFMSAIMTGATTGRALLQARQLYVKRTGASGLDPVDAKTLGQFVLLGDPSLRPFGSQLAPVAESGVSQSIVRAARRADSQDGAPRVLAPVVHRSRRKRLKAQGAVLDHRTFRTKKAGTVSAKVKASLAALLGEPGLKAGRSMRFAVSKSAGGTQKQRTRQKGAGKRAATAKTRPVSIDVVFSRRSSVTPQKKAALPAQPGEARGRGARPRMTSIRAVVARTRNGEVLSYKTVWSK